MNDRSRVFNSLISEAKMIIASFIGLFIIFTRPIVPWSVREL